MPINTNIKWEYEWERQMTFFVADNIFLAWKIPPKKYAYPLKTYFIMGKANNAVDMHFDKDEIFGTSKKLLDRFLKNKLTDSWIQTCLASCNYLKSYIFSKLNKLDLKKLGNKQLIREFDKFYKVYLNTVCQIVAIRLLNREIQKRLKEYFDKKFNNARTASEILNILTSPEQLSIYALEEIDFLKMAKKIKQNKLKRDSLLKKHFDKYLWLPVGYSDEREWDMGYLTLKLKEINQKVNNTDERIKEIKNQTITVSQKEIIRKKYKIGKQILTICKQSAYGAYFKDLIRERLDMAHYYSRPIFNEIAQRNGLTFKDIKTLGYEEILKIFNTSHEQLQGKIRQRQKSYLLLSLNGKRNEIYDQKSIKKFTKNLQEQNINAILKGVGVSLGKATGKVLKIKKQTVNIKEKDYVLVTTMTTPELVPLMKKAVAVVTDEGGLTCHAAIVSRELKIPCIVGTKIATKVLNDGDLVEVDADKGVIKKI